MTELLRELPTQQGRFGLGIAILRQDGVGLTAKPLRKLRFSRHGCIRAPAMEFYAIQEVMDGAGFGHGVLLYGPRRCGIQADQQCAANPPSGSDRRWAAAVYG